MRHARRHRVAGPLGARRGRCAGAAWGFGASLVVCLTVVHPSAAQVVPTGLAFQNVVLEPFVTNPVGFAFLPDGRILLIEKDSGNVRLAAAGASTSVVIATVSGLANGGERGLLGVAIDPDWPARPYVYFQSTHQDSTVHVSMWTASGDLTLATSTNLTLGSPYLVYKDIRDDYSNHNGGTLRFAPDGMLYVSAGDDARECDAQDLDRPMGKILRLDVSSLPGAGSGPPPVATITPADNPFTGTTDAARLVYAYGLRNPFRFTIDAPTGNLYIGDVGLLAWEEVDELVAAGYAGDNYGWPAREGLVPQTCCPWCAVYPPFTDPVYVYPNPTNPDVSVAVTGGPRYRRNPTSAASFPFDYEGDVFFADFYSGWIRRLKPSGSVWSLAPAVAGQPNATDWATDILFISDLQLGPDGALYFVTMISGTIPRGLHRIVDLTATDAGPPTAGSGIVARPNPTRRGVGFTIRDPSLRGIRASLRIYDPSGRLVRTLPVAGDVAEWDGRDNRGRVAPPGQYFYWLATPRGEVLRGKVTLLH